MCLCLVEGSFVEEDCVRLHTSGLVYDTVCSSIYVTICQRDADLETTSIIDMTSSAEIITTNQKTSEDPTTIEADLFRTTSAHLSTNTDTSVESSTSYKMQLPETTSIMAISSSPEFTTTTQLTVEDHTTIEPELSETTSAHSSTNTETSVESLTEYSLSSRSHAPKVLSTLSSVISTNSTQHCTNIYVSICSNQSNSTSRSAGYTYKVDTKKLSSYKRKHQSASDPRKSSMFIGSVGIAVLISVVLLIMFLDCVPTKDRHPFSTTDIRVRKCLKTINSECLCFLK
ncbi:unnamed protein product [Mytilus edulis]|uniref:Uncharacterized protein n=1 Tax=Mytilus edulis TaxID=6550 RepID=A0A8S3SPD8_MYTED|nr:unnamed protein product [Mytilus edulis]